MKIGYARISRPDQQLSLQEDALREAGCEQIFTDMVSGSKSQRPGLDQALLYARPGDTLVIWKLDRLGRSIKDLIALANLLKSKEVELISISEAMDTSTATGKLMFHVMGALAEFERGLLIERTKAGVDAARSRGRLGGRPRALKEEQIKKMAKLYKAQILTIPEICKHFKICQKSFYNYMHEKGVIPTQPKFKPFKARPSTINI